MRRIVPLVLAVAVALPAGAADLVEPWDPGFTDLELWVSVGEGAEVESTLVAGFGLGNGLSVGASLSGDADGARRLGGICMLTLEGGRGTALDLWAEGGVRALWREAELGSADWSLGTELSRDLGRWIPYLRLTRWLEGGDASLHPLAGAVFPYLNHRLELHLEISSEEPESGPWPFHLAIGPNFHVNECVEVLPELSLIRDRGAGETHVVFTVGLVLDPSRLFGG